MENNKRRSIKNLREILKKQKRYEPKHYKKMVKSMKGVILKNMWKNKNIKNRN